MPRYVPEAGDIVWLNFTPQAGHQSGPAHPSRWTDSTSCPSKPLPKTAVYVVIKQSAHSMICHSMRLRFLQQGKDLLPLHTGKPRTNGEETTNPAGPVR